MGAVDQPQSTISVITNQVQVLARILWAEARPSNTWQIQIHSYIWVLYCGLCRFDLYISYTWFVMIRWFKCLAKQWTILKTKESNNYCLESNFDLESNISMKVRCGQRLPSSILSRFCKVKCFARSSTYTYRECPYSLSYISHQRIFVMPTLLIAHSHCIVVNETSIIIFSSLMVLGPYQSLNPKVDRQLHFQIKYVRLRPKYIQRVQLLF